MLALCKYEDCPSSLTDFSLEMRLEAKILWTNCWRICGMVGLTVEASPCNEQQETNIK
jgi:hypothetical protein